MGGNEVHAFPKDISLEEHVIVWLELEFEYNFLQKRLTSALNYIMTFPNINQPTNQPTDLPLLLLLLSQ